MKKIGILTFHYSVNYGGVLQTYSLYKKLKEFNEDVEVINFIPTTYNKNNLIGGISKKMIFHPFLLIQCLFIRVKYGNSIIKKFDSFRQMNIKLSKQVDEEELEILLTQYDLVIVGSDQVWNPSQRINNEYFLNYPKSNYIKASYAADSTIEQIKENQFSDLKKKLERFDFLSVRNSHSQKFVSSLINYEPEIVLDPTLLVEFPEFILTERKLEENYVLTYILGDELYQSNNLLVDKIKLSLKISKIYSIIIPNHFVKKPNYSNKIFYSSGPIEWLNLIRNASFLLTDSFHGVLFSIKYKIPFLAYFTDPLRSSRFIDLANRFELSKFIISDIDELTIKNALQEIPDFDKVTKIIESYYEKSLDYLIKVIC